MNTTKTVEVVNLKTCKDWGKPGDVRIDRRTKWGNPFSLKKGYTRDEACDMYESYFKKCETSGDLDINELKDAKRLACWCFPARCHGDYLKKRIEEL
jgi:hypothetical protein